MLALYLAGRQSAGLAGIRETPKLLMDELGLEPCEELRELQHGILVHDPVPESVSAETRSGPRDLSGT
jgi:DNA-binding SARP family transcriptional activator